MGRARYLYHIGKVVGGGFPIGVVAGSKNSMDALDGGHWHTGDDSQPKLSTTWFAGTFVRHPPALAAAKAVLLRLKEEGPALQAGLRLGLSASPTTLNAHFRATGTPMFLEYFSSFFVVKFETYQEYANLLFYHLHARGIYTYEGRPAFITTEHSEADMRHIGDAFKGAVATCNASACCRVGRCRARTRSWRSRCPTASRRSGWPLALVTMLDGVQPGQHPQLRGALNRRRLQVAMDQLVARHEALRAVPTSDGLRQCVLPVRAREDRDPPPRICGRSTTPRGRRTRAVRRAEVETPFDLDHGPLLRAR